MKRLVLAVLAVISLLLGVSASIGSQVTPAQAETTIPEYGAPDYVEGSPVGGSVGYLNTIDPSQADYVVSTASELRSALGSATSGQIVYVADGAVVVLPVSTNSLLLSVPAGVTLASGRGRAGVTPGIIERAVGSADYEDNYWYLLRSTGANTRFIGLILNGNQPTVSRGYNWTGISCGENTEVANCEIYGFGQCGVDVLPGVTDVWIHHNNFHHCQREGAGYGCDVYGGTSSASAIIEANLFDYHRHAMAGGGGHTSYIFRYNRIGAHINDHQIDCHGPEDGDKTKGTDGDYTLPAGMRIEVYNNTSIHTTSPTNGYAQNFVEFRGAPDILGYHSVHNNWAYVTHVQRVWERMSTLTPVPPYGYNADMSSQNWVRMSVYDNWWGTTAPPSTNRAPVLNAVGNKAIVESGTLAFTITATDPDGDTLTYSASNLPAGAAFDLSTRTFWWTPEEGQAGVYAGILFEVGDGSLSDTEYITITVTNGIQVDVNSDGAVNSLDMIRVGQHWNEMGEGGWIPEDINRDGTVSVLDATLVGQHWTG